MFGIQTLGSDQGEGWPSHSRLGLPAVLPAARVLTRTGCHMSCPELQSREIL